MIVSLSMCVRQFVGSSLSILLIEVHENFAGGKSAGCYLYSLWALVPMWFLMQYVAITQAGD